jgi:hypothetical protein
MKTLWWRVWFDADTCVIMDGPDEWMAVFRAQMAAWEVTGRWYHPTKVEAYR